MPGHVEGDDSPDPRCGERESDPREQREQTHKDAGVSDRTRRVAPALRRPVGHQPASPPARYPAASRERTWRANLLVPVEDPGETWHRLGLYRDLDQPKGFIRVVGLTDRKDETALGENLENLCGRLREEGVFASWAVISSADFSDNLGAGVEAFGGTFFRPNVLALTLPDDPERQNEVRKLLDIAEKEKVGVSLLIEDPRGSPYQRDSVNVWFPDRGPDRELSMELENQDLPLLLGYKLMSNWAAELRLVAPVEEEAHVKPAREYLRNLAELARLPDAEIVAEKGGLEPEFGAPRADLDILPLPEEPDFDRLRQVAERLGSPCQFTRDAGTERALA